MLATLKIEDGKWDEIAPLAYYLTPLAEALKKVRQALMKMEKAGPLFNKYIIEDNKELQDLTIALVKKDLVVQWLMGTELKKDQFRFFFDTCRLIFDSALRPQLLKADQTIVGSIIPKLVAFKSVMVLRNISIRKEREGRLAKEKEERDKKSQRAGRQIVDVEALS